LDLLQQPIHIGEAYLLRLRGRVFRGRPNSLVICLTTSAKYIFVLCTELPYYFISAIQIVNGLFWPKGFFFNFAFKSRTSVEQQYVTAAGRILRHRFDKHGLKWTTAVGSRKSNLGGGGSPRSDHCMLEAWDPEKNILVWGQSLPIWEDRGFEYAKFGPLFLQIPSIDFFNLLAQCKYQTLTIDPKN